MELLRRYGEDESADRAQVTVLGRITAVRSAGAMIFLDLEDGSGRIQLMAGRRYTREWSDLRSLSVGTATVEASGTVSRSHTGQLSVKVLQWRQL